jgi:hypothetical protein
MSNCNDTTTSSKPTEVSNIIKADVNFTVIKGDTFDAVVNFRDAEQKPLNFVGATMLMYIKSDPESISISATLQAGAGFVVTGSTITFNYITTLAPGTYFYDLQCTFANGLKKTLIGGKYKVQQEITTA